MNVGDVVRVFRRKKTQLIGRAVGHTTLNTTASQPGAESLRMVVAASSLRRRRAPEFSTPNHKRVLQQTSAPKVFQQARDRFVDLAS